MGKSKKKIVKQKVVEQEAEEFEEEEEQEEEEQENEEQEEEETVQKTKNPSPLNKEEFIDLVETHMLRALDFIRMARRVK